MNANHKRLPDSHEKRLANARLCAVLLRAHPGATMRGRGDSEVAMQSGQPNIVAYSLFGPIIVNVHDAVISRTIFEAGIWNYPQLDIILRLVQHILSKKEKILFYDIGANFGIYSLALAKRFGSKIVIKAFEAQRMIYHALCGTMALNNLANVECLRYAISDSTGESIVFFLPDYKKSNNL